MEVLVDVGVGAGDGATVGAAVGAAVGALVGAVVGVLVVVPVDVLVVVPVDVLVVVLVEVVVDDTSGGSLHDRKSTGQVLSSSVALQTLAAFWHDPLEANVQPVQSLLESGVLVLLDVDVDVDVLVDVLVVEVVVDVDCNLQARDPLGQLPESSNGLQMLLVPSSLHGPYVASFPVKQRSHMLPLQPNVPSSFSFNMLFTIAAVSWHLVVSCWSE